MKMKAKIKIQRLIGITFVLTVLSISFFSCEKEGGCGSVNISKSGGSKSHNKGQNCMVCHTNGGEGSGCFTVAGTVYNSALTSTAGSGKVEFFTQVNGSGQLMYTVQIDSKGNFYTTEDMNIAGLFPRVTGPTGTQQSMSTGLVSGKCNVCHNATTAKIWAD
jgi:hypothetical protein